MIKLRRIHGKKAGAELLTELILATVLFFVLVLIIFVFLKGMLTINVLADIKTPDSAYRCEVSLLNLLNTPVDIGSGEAKPRSQNKWQELVLRDYFSSNFEKSQKTLADTLEKYLGDSRYKLAVSRSGDSLFTKGSKQCNEDNPCFNCSAWLALPVGETEQCRWRGIESDKKDRESAEFNTPEGQVSFVVKNTVVAKDTEKAFGIYAGDLDREKVQISQPAYELAGKPEWEVTDTTGMDFIAISLQIKSQDGKWKDYELTLEETESENSGKVRVRLARVVSLESCAIKVMLAVKGTARTKEGLR